ncbi:unnamed protein product [Lymnaea stagnalis]|uniref:Sulfatase N-terminal domain-containing protein n=1 Tax=Lymnaea stagnalis TaxID=6523 RepID=A0AAV2HM27_LYMST
MLKRDLRSLSRLLPQSFLVLLILGPAMYYVGFYTIIQEHTTKLIFSMDSKGKLETLTQPDSGVNLTDIRYSLKSRLHNSKTRVIVRDSASTRKKESEKEHKPGRVTAHNNHKYIRNNKKASLSRGVKVGKRDSGEESLACVFPRVNPFDPEIMAMSGLNLRTLECHAKLPDLLYIDGNTLAINKTKVHEKLGGIQITCQYQEILPGHNFLGPLKPPFNDFQVLPKSSEFIRVVCQDGGQKVVSRMYFALIPKREKRSQVEALLLKKREMESAPRETLNVIMIGVDGVSRHHFMRSMTRTYPLLMNDFRSFDMSMYTQVGKNTFPNFIPLLTGRSEDEINTWWDFSKYTDGFDLVWRDYARAGYTTLYTEDWPTIGAFSYEKKGFLVNPTTHFSRSLCVVMEHDKEIWNTGNQCVGEQPEVNFHFDYVKRLFDTFHDKPLYAMAFLTKVSHDDMTHLKIADEHVFNFYRVLQKSGYLNNTVLITFSDHGPRWGPIRSSINGMYEGRTPFAIFTFPKWFLEKYPDVARNLNTNTGRLTTHYDTHATLTDLLYFRGNGDAPVRKNKHGISLLQKIPKNRTCKDIPIPEEYCLCGQSTVERLDTSTEPAKILAKTTLAAINLKINKTICVALKIEEILQVVKVELPKNLSEGKHDKYLFRVRLQTTPGHAVFEATVFAREVVPQTSFWGTKNHFIIDVAERIDRLNLYRGQADCVSDARIKAFCYCKNLHNEY